MTKYYGMYNPALPSDQVIIDMDSIRQSNLKIKNVTIAGRRTSIRMEQQMHDALREVAGHYGMTIHELCTLINGARPKGQSLASAIRVYLLDFYRKGGTSQRRPNEDPANDTGTR